MTTQSNSDDRGDVEILTKAHSALALAHQYALGSKSYHWATVVENIPANKVMRAMHEIEQALSAAGIKLVKVGGDG